MNLAAVSELSQSLFDWVWRTSFHATVLIVLVVLVQRLFGRVLSARCRYGLWLLVLLRLVLPVAPASSFSIFNLGRHFPPGPQFATRRTPATETGGQLFQPISKNPAGRMNETASQMRQRFAGARLEVDRQVQAEKTPAGDDRARLKARAARRIDLKTGARLLWLSGCLASLLVVWRKHRGFSRCVADQPAIDDGRLLCLVEECKHVMSVRRAIAVFVVAQVRRPALFGFRRPRLLMPEGILEKLNDRELRMVLQHELAHVKRADILLNWVIIFVRALHWFNPLVWLSMRCLRADRELVCDAMVLSRLAADQRQIYGNTLIKLLDDFSDAGFCPSLAPVINNEKEIKRRVIMIAGFKPVGRVALVFSAMLVVALCCFTFTRAAEKQTKTSSEARVGGQLDAEREDAKPATLLEALKKELEHASANVDDAQGRANRLRKELGISDRLVEGESFGEGGSLSVLNPQSVREFESERVRVESELRRVESLLKALRSKGESELQNIMNVAVPDELLTSLLKAKAENEQKLASLLSSLGPENPEVNAVLHRDKKVQNQIKSRIDGIMAGLQVQLEATSAHIESLNRAVDQAKRKDAETTERLRPYLEARRRLQDTRKIRDAIQLRILQETVDAALPKHKSQEK